MKVVELLEFNKSIIEIIKLRKSIRTYEKRKLSNDLKEKINQYLENISFNECRFKLLELKDKKEKLGTYGMIKNADTFIVAILDREYKDILKFGYIFEKIILFLTSLDLGTCWLGGTFNKKQFQNKLIVNDNQFIPIVSPVGYYSENQGILRKSIRKIGGFDKRKNYNEIFFDRTFDNYLDMSKIKEEFKVALDMVRIAPSATNRQPWRIIKNENTFDFYIERLNFYKNAIDFDIQVNDIGIAMCHFELTLNELNIFGEWKVNDISNNKFKYLKSFVLKE